MSTIKVIELVGVSNQSFHGAVEAAVEDASKTLRNITGFDVLKTTGKVNDGAITEYHANVKFAFKVDG
jgi:hypothetical protein